MGWIAMRTMKVKRGSATVTVHRNDPVPEAENWPNRQAWERCGSIKWVPDAQMKAEKPKATKRKPVVKPKPAPEPTLTEEPKPEKVEEAKPDRPTVELPSKSALRDMKKADMMIVAASQGLVVEDGASRAEILDALLELYG